MTTHFKTVLTLLLAIILIAQTGNSQQWSELGGNNSLQANGNIRDICADHQGNIYAGGFFTNAEGNYYVAKWDGSTWSELGGPNSLAANGVIYAICTDAAGNVYAAGDFTNSSEFFYVAKWDGNTWSELGSSNYNDPFFCLGTDAAGINIYAAGNLVSPNGPYSPIVKWDGSNWSELAGNNGIGGQIFTLCTDNSGNLYAGGGFQNNDLNTYVAKCNGAEWSELGGSNSLVIESNCYVNSIAIDASGNIFAAGLLSYSNPVNYIAYFSNGSWSEIGAFNGSISCLQTDELGNLYAAGSFSFNTGDFLVAKYDGNTWSELGGDNSLAANLPVNTMCIDDLGNIYAAGDFSNDNGNKYVAKFGNTTGINTNPAKPSVSVYPNPTTNIVSLRNAQKFQGSSYTLYNAIGQPVLVGTIYNQNQTINIAELANGIYLLRLDDSDSETIRIIKE